MNNLKKNEITHAMRNKEKEKKTVESTKKEDIQISVLLECVYEAMHVLELAEMNKTA